jgi:hypothetical protein
MKLTDCLLLVGIALATGGCVGWQRTSLPGPAPDAPLRLGAARVTHVHGYSVELSSVVVSADSVVGWRAREPLAGTRLALHRSQVRHLQRHGFAPVRTALAIGLIVAVAEFATVLQGP